jgi:hypothetical protein
LGDGLPNCGCANAVLHENKTAAANAKTAFNWLFSMSTPSWVLREILIQRAVLQ